MFNSAVKNLQEEVIAWRRHFHKYPEVSFKEFKTSDYIADELMSFGNIEISRPTATGVVGRILGTKAGQGGVVGIRADIDALPMPEHGDCPFASTNPNVMHSCGHDGHAAMLLGAAKLLSTYRDQFCGEVRLIFQHAEESPPGGAIEMVRAGVVDGVELMLGIHLSSNWDTGIFGLRYGSLTANSDRFDITITGKGGHCAFPNQCVDVIVTGAQLIMALQTIASRKATHTDPIILSICMLKSGTAYNILPNTITLTGSTRCFSATSRRWLKNEIERIIQGITAAAGAGYQFIWEEGYPAVSNDHKVTSIVEKQLLKTFGGNYVEHIEQLMPGEDFSYFVQDRPGCFLELGTRNAAIGADMPHHNSKYIMDEGALIFGVQYYFDIVKNILNGSRENLWAAIFCA